MPASDYTPSDTLKAHKKCTMCKEELPIENFAICDRYGGRRGKSIKKSKHIERNFIYFKKKEREDVGCVMK
jgi:hypothetical protein